MKNLKKILIVIAMLALLFWKKEVIPARWLNTIAMMVTVVIIGYGSYAAIVIRSAADTPMDQNSPDNVFALKSYLNREQYGDRPLIYGPVYNAPVKRIPEGMYCVPETKQGGAQYAPKQKRARQIPPGPFLYVGLLLWQKRGCVALKLVPPHG